ncbi:unnamed protein product [Nezara viridula]|uniref:Neuropeptide n=1 Tax=Nezara viridula TaxID=85310 RepID=A0A9P0H8Z8_NEZVI|nr:unnamed protein product [Nezara viridula]
MQSSIYTIIFFCLIYTCQCQDEADWTKRYEDRQRPKGYRNQRYEEHPTVSPPSSDKSNPDFRNGRPTTVPIPKREESNQYFVKRFLGRERSANSENGEFEELGEKNHHSLKKSGFRSNRNEDEELSTIPSPTSGQSKAWRKGFKYRKFDDEDEVSNNGPNANNDVAMSKFIKMMLYNVHKCTPENLIEYERVIKALKDGKASEDPLLSMFNKKDSRRRSGRKHAMAMLKLQRTGLDPFSKMLINGPEKTMLDEIGFPFCLLDIPSTRDVIKAFEAHVDDYDNQEDLINI